MVYLVAHHKFDSYNNFTADVVKNYYLNYYALIAHIDDTKHIV